MTTARVLVRGALLDLGVVSAEQPIEASMVQDGLDLLNAMLDSWSLEALTVYYTPPTAILWPAGTQARTWGPGGDIATLRPLKLQPYAQYRDDATGLELPLGVLARQAEYAALTLKAQTSSVMQVLYYAPSLPLGTLSCWPIPTRGWTVVVYPWQPFTRWTHLDEDVLFPPGYERALRAGLALECCPQYGVQPSPLTVGILAESKANLKRMNSVVPVLTTDPSLGEQTARDPYAIYRDV